MHARLEPERLVRGADERGREVRCRAAGAPGDVCATSAMHERMDRQDSEVAHRSATSAVSTKPLVRTDERRAEASHATDALVEIDEALLGLGRVKLEGPSVVVSAASIYYEPIVAVHDQHGSCATSDARWLILRGRLEHLRDVHRGRGRSIGESDSKGV